MKRYVLTTPFLSPRFPTEERGREFPEGSSSLLMIDEQDKHAKQLANKLAARLQRCENERQWSDVAFALGLLQHKDEEISKVIAEGFKVVQAAA